MRKYSSLLVTSYLFIIFAGVAFAETKDEPIVCNGDKIEYMEGNKKLQGSGNIVLTYQEMKISADKVDVNLETKEAYATGHVILTQGANVFKAESVLYDFQKKTGKLINGVLEAPPWYGRCDEIDKVGDKEYVLGSGYISTCDRIPPHYKIRTKQVRLYLGDKIEAKNVVICAGNLPILYLPTYAHNIKSKKPMVAVVPGHSKEWGYYNLTSVRYALSDNQQGKIHMDVRSKKGFASGVTHSYSLDFSNTGVDSENKSLGKGIFDLYYMNENDKNKPESTDRERQRYKISLRHRWEMDPKTLAMLEYNKLTDASFTKDYFYRQEYVNEMQPKTYVSLSHREPGYSTSFLYQDRVNNFFTETEYSPQMAIDIKNQRLMKDLPIYYKSEYSAAGLAKKYANSDIDDDANRLDSKNELSYVVAPIKSINMNPYIGTRQTWYSKDKFGNEDRTRGVFYAGIDTSTKFYRTYDVQSKIATTEINGLRHIVTPVVRYAYIHKPTIFKDELSDFDDIDTIQHKNAITFAIENDFQTRMFSKDNEKKLDGPYDTIDLARFILSTDYNFDRTPGGEFTNITGDLELRPSDKFLIESDASLNPHSRKFDIVNLDFVTKADNGARFGLGHRYQRGESNEMTFDTQYPLTKKLDVHCYERYQFKTKDLEEQEYGFGYDLHCWIMDLNFNRGDSSAVWVIFRLKAFPDFPIQLGSTYESPKPESPISK